MSWSKLIGDLAKAAATKYVEERGIDGMIEDAGKVASFAKKGYESVGSLFSADSNGDGKIDANEVEKWMSSFVPEMMSCLDEAKSQNVLSQEFEENIQNVLTMGYDAINEIFEVDENLECLEAYVNEIDGICDQAFELIFNKCNGAISSGVTTDNIRLPFSMQVKGSYPVNWCHDMTLITGAIMSGKIAKDDIITLPNGESASVKFIKMFGKTLDEAECGDVCALILDGYFYDDLENETPFVIGTIPTEVTADIDVNNIDKSEQEYIEELKACLEDDGEISERERRLLNRLCQSLGITEERAKELESGLQFASNLTPEEQEYANEVKACLEDGGEITPKERRLLDKIRKSLGISEERAKEIEQSV